jgi:hypothetical protein
MSPQRRTIAQLVLAITTLVITSGLLWVADSAMGAQYGVLEGCWPRKTYFNGQAMLTVDFWRDYVEHLNLSPLSEFFHTRVRHRILLYVIILCSVVGWSGSILLRVVISGNEAAKQARVVDNWETVISSLFLALIGGAILFLLLVSTRLMLDPDPACIAEAYAYVSAAGGIACGLFVVLFFGWFESLAKKLWDTMSGSH